MSKKQPPSALVCLNGNLDSGLPFVDPESYLYILAVDGAIDELLSRGITPSAVIGDMDSASPVGLKQAEERGVEILLIEEQETSDFEKALQHLDERGFTSIDVIGIRGTRLDHELAALEAAAVYSPHIAIRIIDSQAEGFLVSGLGEKSINGKKGCICSVLPIHPCEGVSLAGFKWPMSNARLGSGFPYSLSNVVIRERASVTVRNGTLLIYLHRNTVDNK